MQNFKELADTALTEKPLVAKNCKIDEIMPNTELVVSLSICSSLKLIQF